MLDYSATLQNIVSFARKEGSGVFFGFIFVSVVRRDETNSLILFNYYVSFLQCCSYAALIQPRSIIKLSSGSSI